MKKLNNGKSHKLWIVRFEQVSYGLKNNFTNSIISEARFVPHVGEGRTAKAYGLRKSGIKKFKYLLVLILFITAGCGVKANPVPYALARPAFISDLTALARGDGIILTWTVPSKNTDGTVLKDIKGFNLVRAGAPITLIGTKEVYRQWRYPYKRGEHFMIIKDTDVNYGFRYSYIVFTVTKEDIVSDASNIVVVNWDIPYNPPADLRANSGNNFVELHWYPPSTYINNTKINTPIYYNIYRSLKMDNFPLFPINPVLISGTTYIDGELKNNVPYFYAVTSVSKVFNTPVESRLSNEILAVPINLVPPARPYALSGAPIKSGIALSWEPNTRSDILGYYIYRKSGNEKLFRRLNAIPISSTTYIDKTAVTGYNIYYVTAVDNSSEHNESAQSEPITIFLQEK